MKAGASLATRLRWLISLTLVGGLFVWLDPGRMLATLERLSPGWLLLAFLLVIPQMLLSAWRWQLTARQLGLTLTLRRAVSEYWLAGFLNQLLPGGVAGDAARAWRHGSRDVTANNNGGHGTTYRGRALRAVIIERASGQLALLLIALLAVLLSAPLQPLMTRGANSLLILNEYPLSWRLALTLLSLILLTTMVALLHRHPPKWMHQLQQDIRRSWGAPGLWWRQLLSSLLVVTTYIAVFCCTARALALPLAIHTLIPLTALVLMAMAIPLSVAGWGIREGAAALVWSLAALPPEQGVTLSIAYGVVTLLSTLPGALVLLIRSKPMTAEGHSSQALIQGDCRG
ncbi:lysylphosphatidylglycerol synthase transmembrane domain-containing protein [Kushneria phosphatilytica]|uniref:Flippase-like domain-containing protein n=1 Tax=Kushneria phosphatilytica TaxID=657387 RepID=A0A1S1NW26_9GAMM|nr:lysylphosphatidylglycerol synthase transmembrane domain-containing protein [Kushneria phosphatilytica]OHV12161.1 hypothetical protein BH688_05785 [Kushneria phosphatilytica]QEL11354.1 flippase-like domain-containing protein [Kushneria phosphatilytica]